MRINTNKAYAHQAAETVEQVTALAFMLALHQNHGFGAKRLNRLKQEATEIVTSYYKHYAGEPKYRGAKYNGAGVIVDAMMRDVLALGVEAVKE